MSLVGPWICKWCKFEFDINSENCVNCYRINMKNKFHFTWVLLYAVWFTSFWYIYKRKNKIYLLKIHHLANVGWSMNFLITNWFLVILALYSLHSSFFITINFLVCECMSTVSHINFVVVNKDAIVGETTDFTTKKFAESP